VILISAGSLPFFPAVVTEPEAQLVAGTGQSVSNDDDLVKDVLNSTAPFATEMTEMPLTP
jgi:hypothetical protein